MRFCAIHLAFFLTFNSSAQNIGIGNPFPDNSSLLDLTATTKGLLIPRMSTAAVSFISNPAKGLLVYDSLKNQLMVNMGTSSVPVWQTIVYKSGWSLTGNSGNNPSVNFLGTTDNIPLKFRVNNVQTGLIDTGNVFLGNNAGFNNISGTNKIAIGTGALYNSTADAGIIAIGDSALAQQNGGSGFNTAVGSKAMRKTTTGYANTAVGNQTLYSNTTGSGNTAYGDHSLFSNTAGWNNTAYGNYSLFANITGESNVAAGTASLQLNETGGRNLAMGNASLYSNISGSYNTAGGYQSMFLNTTGSFNTAWGTEALKSNTTGENNVAIGMNALYNNTGGYFNVALGKNALYTHSNGDYNVAVGAGSLDEDQTGSANTAAGAYSLSGNTSGSNNVSIGQYSLFNNTTGSLNTAVGQGAGYYLPANVNNVTCIGYSAGFVTTLTNHINIGNTSVTWLGGQTGFFNYSDERIKDNIQENVPGLEFINRLRPVTYNLNIHRQNEMVYADKKGGPDWNGKYDIEQILQTGFVAQEVEKAANEISFSFNGIYKPAAANGLYSLNYSQFVVPLVKAVQEQQQQINEQHKTITELKNTVNKLAALLMKKIKD